MSYPHTRLTRPIRLAIMITLIMLFFVISPLVLLYTAGYRYDWHTRQIQQTGVISIDIRPEDATVMINNVVIHKQMPIRLANRAPGRYTLTIQKPGYHTLTKDIEVESKHTTYIRDVPLFKETLPEMVFEESTDLTTAHTLSYDGRFMLLITPNENQALYTARVIDLSTQETMSQITLATSSTPHGEWSPTHPYGLIASSQNNTHIYHFIDATKKESISSITLASSSTPRHQWQQKNSAPLLIQDGHTLIEASNNGFIPNGDIRHAIWHVDQDESVWEFDLTSHILTRRDGNIITDSRKLDDAIVDIFFAHSSFILARTTRGIAIIKLEKNNIHTEQLPTEMIQFDPKRNEWVTWSSSEVWRIASDGKPTLLTRLGIPIQYVYPMDEFGTLLLDTGEKILAFHPQFYSIQSLFERGNVDTKGINQKTRTIYFTGKVGNRHALFQLGY